MKSKKTRSTELRAKAEEKSLHVLLSSSLEGIKQMSPEEIAAKMHELYVHKIELEMQNEELYKTQIELFSEKMRYFELYDMAPVGYLTLDCEGRIMDANLASASFIGTERAQLQRQLLSQFIFAEDQDIYYTFRKKIIASQERQVCELRMKDAQGKIFWAQLVAAPKIKNAEISACKLIFNDISELRAFESVKKHNEALHNLSKNVLSALENERKSIAREVHDQLGQLMSVLKIDLLWLKRRVAKEPEELTSKIDMMLAHVRLALQSVRNIVVQLRPLILDDLGLEAAMEWHLQRYLQSLHVKHIIDFKIDEKYLQEELKIVLFRLFQEALTNVARHAKATKVFVSLAQEDETLILQITDNGIGITQKQIDSPTSYGLIGIRERLHPYAGTLSISTHEGLGTTLRVSIKNFKKELLRD